MKVHFFATLRPLAGGKTVEFAAQDGITVRELLDNIVIRFPAMRKRLLNDDGQLYEHVHVFINGRDVHLLENELDTTIRPDDEINIFPAIGGGCQ